MLGKATEMCSRPEELGETHCHVRKVDHLDPQLRLFQSCIVCEE